MSLAPLPADIPAKTTVAMVQRLVTLGEAPALTAHSIAGAMRTISGREFPDVVARMAGTLRARGVRPADRVCIVLENRAGLEATIVHLAIHWCGAVAVPMNTRLSDREWNAIITHADPALICAEGAHLLRLQQREGAEQVPTMDVSSGVFALLADQLPEPSASVNEDDLADIMYTSGTTGAPKGVELTHGNTVACGWELLHAMQLSLNDTLQSAVPFFTSTGAHTNPMAAFMTPCHYVLEPDFDQSVLLDRLHAYATTVYFAVPSMLTLAMRDLPLPQGLPQHLDRVVFGGSVTTRESLESLAAAFPGRGLINLYGLTEGGPGGSCIGPDDILLKPGSVGCHGNGPNTTVAVLRDDGTPADPDEVGEIVVRSPAVMRGYRNNPEATQHALRGGWLHTSDYGTLDADGYLWYVGRRDDLVVRGGFNIATTEVEAVFATYPGITEVAVVGMPHDILGQDIVAHLVVDAMIFDESGLTGYMRENLADYKIPRRWVYHDALPRSAMGKILKRLLPDVP